MNRGKRKCHLKGFKYFHLDMTFPSQREPCSTASASCHCCYAASASCEAILYLM